MRRRVQPGDRPRVVLLVENHSVPSDARVWNEATLLRDAGYQVTVVSPTGEDDTRENETELVIDDITVRRFPLKRAAGGAAGFVVEYLTALIRLAAIVWRLPGPVAVIHSANPPDLLFLIGLVPKLRWGTKLVFDHHDLVPELYRTRFGEKSPILPAIRLAERLSFATADAVISTNESYRQVAIERGRKRPDQVRVVRNARDRASFKPVEPDSDLRRGRKHLAVYVGFMGPQDGADAAIRVAAHYRDDLGRDDLQVTLVGDGDHMPECRRLVDELDLGDRVHFAGWCERDEVLRYLSTADVGLATDLPNPLNDRSTMIKVIEYIAIGLPVVSFDLSESRVTAGDAALYSPDGDELHLATNLARVLDDQELRDRMRASAAERMAGPLSWETARQELLATYSSLLGDAEPTPVLEAAESGGDDSGRSGASPA